MFDDHLRTELAAKVEPLLASDTFLFLAECSVCIVPTFSWDILHVMRLCYIAEIVKAVIMFGRDCELTDILRGWERTESLGDIEGHIGYTELQLNSLQRFAKFIEQSIGTNGGGELGNHSSFALAVFRHLIGTYATPFLRKCVMLLHTRFGVLFSFSGFSAPDEPESTRLCKILGLPSVDEIFESCLADNAEGEYLRRITSGWCEHLTLKGGYFLMSHPAIFELVGLPKNFDVLVEEAMKRKCPTTGNEITDPSVCLFCGDIFCSQALCCLEEVGNEEEGYKNLGGCNRHMQR
jgi:E3 ubiquitin-protein ligase UBR1